VLLGKAGAISASVITMLYASPSEERPKRLTMNRLMRRPSPDLTTACATMNAMTTSSTLVLAKPANALAGVIVPVSTTAAAASIVAVNSGNAPTSTEAIAATNTAKRCHAGAVRPAGTGVIQMPMASTNGSARLHVRSGSARLHRDGVSVMTAVPAQRCRRARGRSAPAILPARCPPRTRARIATKLVAAGRAGVAPGSAEERADDPVALRGAFAPQFAVHLVAALIGPDRATDHARSGVVEDERFGTEADARREGPASSNVPSKLAMDARRSPPSGISCRLPVAVTYPRMDAIIGGRYGRRRRWGAHAVTVSRHTVAASRRTRPCEGSGGAVARRVVPQSRELPVSTIAHEASALLLAQCAPAQQRIDRCGRLITS
jgi:hypothetical protein